MVALTLLRRPCQSAIVNIPRIMKPADILALLPVKPEDMPKIATTTNKTTRSSIKNFQESIKYQAMAITVYDHNLGLLGMDLRASDFNPLKNSNPFAPPTDPRTDPINDVSTVTQITEVIRLCKDDKDKFATYCEFHIILISMITNKCPEKYMTTLNYCITKIFQFKPLALLTNLYTEYGTITSSDLTENSNFMNDRWNSPTPNAGLFQQLYTRK